MKHRKDKAKREAEIASVLVHQHKQISSIRFQSPESLRNQIDSSQELLQRSGYDVTGLDLTDRQQVTTTKPPIVVPSWNALVAEAERDVGVDCSLKSIFTDAELKSNEEALKQLRSDYNQLHKLDKWDIAICALAGIIAGAVDILLVGIPQRGKDGPEAGTLSNYIKKYFDKVFSPDQMEKLANSKDSKVPFDAQDNRTTTIRVEGLSAYYHRLLQLGHDPLLGFVVGVMDIMKGKMTTIDKAGKIVSQTMENYADRVEPNLFKAIAKELAHLKSDVTTSMGLPAPLMGLFNLLQFGSIGEEELTIAEIVQGMYYEGYDFIQFCSSSIPVMIVEVIIRLGYAVKRIKEGHPIKESIPFSLDRNKCQKLATMLFIGHSAATGINAGKVEFTKNPVAINYPQWLAFAKYSFIQLKWAVATKPSARNAYIEGRINSELYNVFNEINSSFQDYSSGRIVIYQ